nr:MAG TPA: hypothetical protein [Caudoviricetes sp.]
MAKHILERLNGEIIQNYMPIISYCICRLFQICWFAR